MTIFKDCLKVAFMTDRAEQGRVFLVTTSDLNHHSIINNKQISLELITRHRFNGRNYHDSGYLLVVSES